MQSNLDYKDQLLLILLGKQENIFVCVVNKEWKVSIDLPTDSSSQRPDKQLE